MLRIEIPSDMRQPGMADHAEAEDHKVTITNKLWGGKTTCHGSGKTHDPEAVFYLVADEQNYLRTYVAILKEADKMGDEDLSAGKGMSLFIQCSRCLRVYRLEADFFDWQTA